MGCKQSRNDGLAGRGQSREVSLLSGGRGEPRYQKVATDGDDYVRAAHAGRPRLNRSNSSLGLDIVQFSCPIFFAEENEEKFEVEVMRMGTFHGKARVRFETLDVSAKSGLRYEKASGTLTFDEGVHSMKLPISIVAADVWAAVLEFKVALSEPENCELGAYLHTCRVKIIDNDHFPTSRYGKALDDALARGDKLEDGVDEIPGPGLFIEYCRLLLHIPGMGLWISLTMIMDQLSTLYLFFKLYAGVYIVNTLFNTHDLDTEDDWLIAWMYGNRQSVAYIFALGYVAPMAILHVWDLLSLRIDLHGKIRLFLQENLFRQYLNFNEETRLQMKDSRVEEAILCDSDDLSEGFLGVLSVVRITGRIGVMIYFTLQENPEAVKFVVVMPIIMFTWVWLRHVIFAFDGKADHTKYALRDLVREAIAKYRLIANYFQRPAMNDRFHGKVELLRLQEVPEKMFQLNNTYFFKWLDPLFAAFFLATQAQAVLHGGMKLGNFLATLSIFREVCSSFSEGYEVVVRVIDTVEELRDLTVLLNQPTDCLAWKQMNRQRRKETEVQRVRQLSASGLEESTVSQGSLPSKPDQGKHVEEEEETQFKSDLINIQLKNMGFAYKGDANKKIFDDVNIQVQQGLMVAVVGEHGEGINTFMRLIAHELFPCEGSIFVPTHLRIVHVTQQAMLTNTSIWDNLVFGLGSRKRFSSQDCKRIKAVLQALEMHACLKMIREELEKHERRASIEDVLEGDEHESCCAHACHACSSVEEEEEEDEVDDDWQGQLSYTEAVKIHLARALIMNPEVLVVQRPLRHYNETASLMVLDVLRQHVSNRGIGLPEVSAGRRRPRTLFFTAEAIAHQEMADVIWMVKDRTVMQVSEMQRQMRKQTASGDLSSNLSGSPRKTLGDPEAQEDGSPRLRNPG